MRSIFRGRLDQGPLKTPHSIPREVTGGHPSQRCSELGEFLHQYLLFPSLSLRTFLHPLVSASSVLSCHGAGRVKVSRTQVLPLENQQSSGGVCPVGR